MIHDAVTEKIIEEGAAAASRANGLCNPYNIIDKREIGTYFA